MVEHGHWFEKYQVARWLPENRSGVWAIERFEISAMDSAVALFSHGTRAPRPGLYTRLVRGERRRDGANVMSDTPAEVRDHLGLFGDANGRVLIAGLGLGMATAGVLMNPRVNFVHVIELSLDVIHMVEEPLVREFGRERFTIEHGDIFERKPEPQERYDYAWFDVWELLSTENLPEMGKLHRRWARRCGGYASWGRELLQVRRRQEREHEKDYEMFRDAINRRKA